MRHMVFALLLLHCHVAFGQQLASEALTDNPEQLSQAKDAMSKFGEARQKLPSQWASFARALSWKLDSDGGSFRESNFLIVSVNDNIAKQSFYAFGSEVKDDTDPTRVGNTYLAMFLKKGIVTITRKGSDLKNDERGEIDPNGKVKGTDDEAPPVLGPLDLYSFCLSDHGTFQTQQLGPDIVRKFYLAEGSKLHLAAVTNREVIGVWQIGKGLATVNFDKEKDLLPVRVSWRFMKDNSDVKATLASGRMYSEVRTEWGKAKFEKKNYWVPWRFTCASPGLSDKSSEHEIEIICDWKFGDIVPKMLPKDRDDHWLTNALIRFEYGAHDDFATFKETVASKLEVIPKQ